MCLKTSKKRVNYLKAYESAVNLFPILKLTKYLILSNEAEIILNAKYHFASKTYTISFQDWALVSTIQDVLQR